jgi:hypothetical protein
VHNNFVEQLWGNEPIVEFGRRYKYFVEMDIRKYSYYFEISCIALDTITQRTGFCKAVNEI